jgi:tRNA(His) 5'-end guanylyltransferase
MQFDNLKDRMEYFKDIANYRLCPNSYVIVHIDGRSFSKKIKKRFNLPFDNDFIRMMDESAAYVCKNVQGCKMAYVQSDEASFIITDFDTPETDSFFSYRLCKIQSIMAALMTSKFNQLYMKYVIDRSFIYTFNDNELFEFDCKAWDVPTYNDAFAWIKYRQNDCIRNSKQQAAQTYLSHNELVNKNTDEQIQMLKDQKGIDWNDYPDGQKFGRLIYKDTIEKIDLNGEPYTRNVWKSHPAVQMTREMFDQLDLVPDRDRSILEIPNINN